IRSDPDATRPGEDDAVLRLRARRARAVGPSRKGDGMATIEKVASFEAPGHPGSPVELKPRYENFVGGHWIAPVHGEYVENLTPATGDAFTAGPASTPHAHTLAPYPA